MSLDINILLLLFQALGPSISQGLSSAVVHHPLLVCVYHTAIHWLIHQAVSSPTAATHTGMHTVQS